jgi:hypothetical protein
METGGWIMLGILWGGILSLGIYCFGKILSQEKDAPEL